MQIGEIKTTDSKPSFIDTVNELGIPETYMYVTRTILTRIK